jgi:hypothetical protein
MFTRDYIELAKRSKGIQRNLVIQEVFGSQVGLALLLGVTRGAVNHIVWLRGASDRIEHFIADEVKRRRPDLLDLWQLPGNHRKAA